MYKVSETRQKMTQCSDTVIINFPPSYHLTTSCLGRTKIQCANIYKNTIVSFMITHQVFSYYKYVAFHYIISYSNYITNVHENQQYNHFRINNIWLQQLLRHIVRDVQLCLCQVSQKTYVHHLQQRLGGNTRCYSRPLIRLASCMSFGMIVTRLA